VSPSQKLIIPGKILNTYPLPTYEAWTRDTDTTRRGHNDMANS